MLDARGVQRAVLAGASMGAHTALRFALEHPERVAALALITPAFDPAGPRARRELAALGRARARAARGRRGGLRRAPTTSSNVPDAWRATVETVLRQRLAAHEHPAAVADALEVGAALAPVRATSPSSRAIDVPTIVVASRDEADPGHPLAVGERYAQAIPGAQLLVEDAGKAAASQPARRSRGRAGSSRA